MRVLGHGLQETAGNGLAHAGERDVLVGGAGSGGSRGAGSLLNVLLGDLAALASALDAVQADALGPGQADGGGSSIGQTVESSLQPALGSVLLRRSGCLRGRRGGGLRSGFRLLLGGRSRGVAASIL